jgi:hypothetical protein
MKLSYTLHILSSNEWDRVISGRLLSRLRRKIDKGYKLYTSNT